MSMTTNNYANKYEIKDRNGDVLHVEGLNDILNQIDSTIPATREERSEIVEPGANYAQHNLWKYAPYHTHQYKSNFYLGSKWRKPQHIHDPDAVTHKPNQYMDGSTDVGYKASSEPIAYWVERGTYRQNRNMFMDRAYQNLDYEMLFNLQARAYENLIRRKSEQN